jgi:hypothetical protein
MLVELGQELVDLHAVIGLKEFQHFLHSDPLICRVGGDLVKKDMVNVNQQLALQLELLPVLEVVVFKLFLLVSFSRSTYLGIVIFSQRLILFLLCHLLL